jgi:rubrerythrin
MSSATFAETIDFALARERAAVAFYEELSRVAAFAAQKSTLAEFRAMEEGHVSMLLRIKERGVVNLSAETAVDLALARNLAAAESPTAGMTFQDILTAAIKKEELSGDLYAELAADAANPEAKAIFERLAAEESRHRRWFEELYDAEIARDN